MEVYVRRFISKGEGLQSKCTVANLEIFLTGFLAAELVDECIGNLVLRVRTERFFRKIKERHVKNSHKDSNVNLESLKFPVL